MDEKGEKTLSVWSLKHIMGWVSGVEWKPLYLFFGAGKT